MGGTPLHVQIRSAIEHRVEEGRWPADCRLPSESELAAEFRVSRMTIRQAVDKLVDTGVLYRRRGVGTFVSPTVLRRDLLRLSSFSEDARARGASARSIVIAACDEVAEGDLATRLRVEAGHRLLRLQRLRTYRDTPVALQTVWVPAHLCEHLVERRVAEGSLYAHFEESHNYRLGWGHQEISARVASLPERRCLGMPSDAALLVVFRTTFLDTGVPLEFSEALYRSDQHSFAVTLHR